MYLHNFLTIENKNYI